MAYKDQDIVVGDTIDFVLLAQKNGVAWDLTGATVTLVLEDPDGNDSAPIAATLGATVGSTTYAASEGAAHYQAAEADLDDDGDWALQWKVSKSGVVLRSERIEFSVLPVLA